MILVYEYFGRQTREIAQRRTKTMLGKRNFKIKKKSMFTRFSLKSKITGSHLKNLNATFFLEKIKYLDHIIDRDCRTPEPDRT